MLILVGEFAERWRKNSGSTKFRTPHFPAIRTEDLAANAAFEATNHGWVT